MSDHYAHTEYGFEWGPFIVERAAHIDGRGWYLHVRTTGTKELVEVYTSEKGRSFHAWKSNPTKELTKVEELDVMTQEHPPEDTSMGCSCAWDEHPGLPCPRPGW